MMLCAVIAVRAQINEGLHWYNGQITFTARNIENKNVLMEAMDEGEEHEFVLRYVKEMNPNHQVYRTANGTHDYVNLYGVGNTMRHKKAEGLDVLCFYDDKNRLAAVISGEKEWDAEKLNKSRWLSQYIGEYTTEEENEVEQCLVWTWESLSFNGIIYPYDIITFNGRVTGYIAIKPVEGSTNELEGTWEVVPTLKGFHLYAVNTETGNMPWEWQRTGVKYELVESDPNVGRFFYASTILLNDHQFSSFDKSTLRIMRNAILARHGYRFQSKDLQEYFANEPWYKPAASNDGIRLSFIEQLNVELIKQMEDGITAEETVEHRKKYHFEYQLVKDDDGLYGSIVVKGREAGDNNRVFECKHELADPQSDDSGSDTDWINDTEDINFDGIPDLQIFLMCYTRGQVARKFAAYVWTSRGQFEEVEQWTDLCNPEIHPENQTITENYRSDINERTYNTYKWNGDKLELINTRKGKFFGE
jgi:hypothetical protein